jgi:hypothetical protein
MKLVRVALVSVALFASVVARGESNTAWKPAPPARSRALALGLLIGGGACLVLGAVFTGLAAQANSDAIAGMKYHPSSEDTRTNYQIAGGAFYIAGGAAAISGVVLLW